MNSLDIKKNRKNLNLTQQELADLLGVSKNTVVNYEKGGKIPDSKIPLLNKILSNQNNIVSENNHNIINEPQEEYKSLSGFDKKIIETIDEISKRQSELIQMDKNSEDYKLTLEIIDLLKEKITLIKKAKEDHLNN